MQEIDNVNVNETNSEEECLIVDLITEPHGGRQIVEALLHNWDLSRGDSMIYTTKQAKERE